MTELLDFPKGFCRVCGTRISEEIPPAKQFCEAHKSVSNESMKAYCGLGNHNVDIGDVPRSAGENDLEFRKRLCRYLNYLGWQEVYPGKHF